MANKITKAELKQMIREALSEELARIKQLKESANNKKTVTLEGFDGEAQGFKVGDKATVTKDLVAYPGHLSRYAVIRSGSVVTVTNVGPRGYDIVDADGNEVDEVRMDYLTRA